MAQQAPHPRMHGLTHLVGGSDPIPPVFLTGSPDVVIGLTYPGAYYKMNEASGNWADSSGNGRDLTYMSRTGTARAQFSPLDEGDTGLAVQVAGPAPAASLSESNVGVWAGGGGFFAFDGSKPMTVSAVINMNHMPGTSFSFGICGNVDVWYSPSGETVGYGLYVLSQVMDPNPDPGLRQKGKVCFRRTGGGTSPQQAVAPAPISLGAWYRVTGVFNGGSGPGGDGKAYLYIDEAAVADSGLGGYATLPAGDKFTRFRVGDCGIAEGSGGTQAPFDGLIDSVVLWDRALTPDEISAIVAAGTEGLVPTTDGSGNVVLKKPTFEVDY